MRFNRDKRGYETTSLVEAGGRRRGRGPGQRLLYWFRTPPGVRVGRAPIDQDAIRLLEQHNPDVEFDWTRILKEPPPEPVRRERDGRERDRRERRDARPAPRPQPPLIAPSPVIVPSPAAIHARSAEAAETRAAAHAAVVLEQQGEKAQKDDESVAVEHREPLAADHAEYVEYAAASGHLDAVEPYEPRFEPADVPDLLTPTPPEASAPSEQSAAAARLGAEALVRLRARYSEIMARIADKPMDEPAREELNVQAERLNPDGWVTADEVTAALEGYESVFESLRTVVGHHPPRRGRR